MKSNQFPEKPLQHELFSAIATANESRVRELISFGADINQPANGPDGETPLIRAVAAGQLNIVRLLVEAGADVNLAQKGQKSWTPLMFAHENATIAQELLDAGADANVSTTARELTPPMDGRRVCCGGETALHLAVAANNAEVAKLLIHAGAHIEAPNANGLAPLDLALALGRPTEAAAVLLEAGAQLTPQRLATMHATAHSTDSVLWQFTNLDEVNGNVKEDTPVQSPHISKGCAPATLAANGIEQDELKCPNCNSLLYSRKARVCGSCGAVIPAELRLTDEQVQSKNDEREWARDLANAFGTRDDTGHSASANPRSATCSAEDLLRQTSCAEEFKTRGRLGFLLYLSGYIMVAVVAVRLVTPSEISLLVLLVGLGLLVVLCHRAWQCATPICPNCKGNIRRCTAVYCHVCGEALRGQHCARCSTDYSWAALFFPYVNSGNFRWIRYCPGCGVWLDSKVRRRRAGQL